jgi:acetylornithine/succinyldiaminopimelate/putrescine aminotransferase
VFFGMRLNSNIKRSALKKQVLTVFRDHVSFGKAAFFQKFGMDFVMGRREGSFLWDMDGSKRLFNLHCNGGVFNLGHRNSELIEVLKTGLDDYDIGNHHLMSKARANLAQMLTGLMPGDLDYAVFGVGGGEAVDLAFKVARAYTHRTKIISAQGGYHGHTGLALAAGDEKYRIPFGPSAPGFVQVPFGDPKAIEDAADTDSAAVVLETVPATLGIVVPTEDYMRAVRRICDRKGLILILDEIQTGLGRTGKLWAFEHFNVIPDIVVVGKGLSGGLYPISATVLRKPLETVFHKDPFIHISTFGGAELGCLVAQRVLQISSDPDFLEHVNRLARNFAEKIEALRQKHTKFLIGLRHLGLMMGLVLKDELSGPLLTKTAYDHGLLMIYANNNPCVCQFLPPLVINAEQINGVMLRLDKAITAARRLKTVLNVKNHVEDLLGKAKIFKTN